MWATSRISVAHDLSYVLPLALVATLVAATWLRFCHGRHLTEFNGLDLEMTITDHYNEIIAVLHNTFKVGSIVHNLYLFASPG